MSGHKKWGEIRDRSLPEVIPTRFPRGTRERLDAIVKKELRRIEENGIEYGDVIRLSPSAMVRRAVREFLEREEKR